MRKSKEKSVKKYTSIYILLLIMIVAIVVVLVNWRGSTVSTISMVNPAKYLNENVEQPKAKGKIIVKYVDQRGNELCDADSLTGEVGEEYSVDAKFFGGFLIDKIPVNKKGNFDVEDQTVTFIYKTDTSLVQANTQQNEVKVTVYKNKDQLENYLEYKVLLKTVDASGNALPGTVYQVKSGDQVVRKGTDYTGIFTLGSLTINNEGTDKYEIIETKGIEGYSPLEKNINLSIVKSLIANSTTNYKANASINEVKGVKLSVDETKKEITVIVTKEIPKPETPEDPKDPEEPEKPEDVVKIFDLEIDKKIKSVTIISEGKETVVEKKSKDSLVKVDIPQKQINNTELKVVYEIVVKNVGEVPGYATCLTDYIPEGMELIGNEDWKSEGKTAINTKFEKTLLNPGDSVSSEVVLSIKLSENNVGTKVNEACIASYYNDEGLLDNTPDNNSKEPLLITIKTGKTAIITASTLIALLAFVGIVYKAKDDKK